MSLNSNTSTDRHARVQDKLRTVLLDLSGLDINELDNSASFMELGFDSLFLIQFSQAIKTNFKVKISFRQLIEDVSTPTALVNYIERKVSDEHLPAAATAATPPAPMAPEQHTQVPAPSIQAAPVAPLPQFTIPQPAGGTAPEGFLKELIANQLQVMSMQLAMLSGGTPPQVAQTALPQAPLPTAAPQTPAGTTLPTPAPASTPSKGEKERQRFGPYKPVKKGKDGGLTEQQQNHLNSLTEKLTQKTAESKRRQQMHRPHFADPRGIAGYRQIWKEMVYQITVEKSKGSKLWDVDGNEYIDIAMGFGLNLFGQSPDFITDAVRERLERGVEIAPQSPLAGEVAKMMLEFSGMERVSFCNTGSEAVMAAIRLARLYSGKDKFALFAGAYHGNFEQVLVRSSVMGNKRKTIPAAPGVPQSIADNAIVLDYGDPASFDYIRQHAHELACVLVEPVQSSQPDLQPRDFLQELRAVTAEFDIALVIDEVITGFRAAPGGAQEYFGIQGDMATYGKVLGGGMPIGALAGKAKYMDGLDSGMWQYGDDSTPEADMTFFAGTFVRHPLAMAAAKAVLTRVKESGPELQEDLSRRTKALVDELNAFFEERQVPIRLQRFRSLFRFSYASDLEYIDLLYYHLLEKGIFTRGFLDNCFLSTAHSQEDEQKIIAAIKESILALQKGGFLPEPDTSPGLKMNGSSAKQTASVTAEPVAVSADRGTDFLAQAPGETGNTQGATYPLTEAQTEIWLASQMSEEASCAYNEPFLLKLQGSLHADSFRKAVNHVFARHDSFRLRFSTDGDHQTLVPYEPITIPFDDLSAMEPASKEETLHKKIERVASTPYDLLAGPLCSVQLFKIFEDEFQVLFSAHHIICDGWSWSVLLEQISLTYNAFLENKEPVLDAPASYIQYATDEKASVGSEDLEEAYAYWEDLYRELPPALQLPTDRPRPSFRTQRGNTIRVKFDDKAYEAAKNIAKRENSSLFNTLFSVFNILLSRLSGQDDIVVTIPTAGQLHYGETALVGHCVNLLPIRTQFPAGLTFNNLIKSTSTRVLDAFDHQECTLGSILQRIKVPRVPSRLPLVEVNFNLDRDGVGLDFKGLQASMEQTRKYAVTFDLFFNVNEMEEGLFVDLDYNADLYDSYTMERWVTYYEQLLTQLANNPEATIASLSLLTSDERDALISEWESTSMAYPSDQSIADLFEAQAERTPDKPAVTYENTSLSYRELNEYANQFARHLGTLGVEPGVLVGVNMERSAGMVVALLGILKSGGAYVPMDPAYPSDRIAHMIADSGLKVLLTEKNLTNNLDLSSFEDDIHIVTLDTEWNRIARRSRKKIETSVTALDPVYVIYTSGSTGKPKGVTISHRSFVNFLWTMKDKPGIQEEDVLASVTTLSFDIAGLEIFLPLITGAHAVILSREEAMDPKLLNRALKSSKATMMQATPATWRNLIESGWKGKKDLKILCGGEAMPISLARSLVHLGSEVWNMYGPTETTVWSSVDKIEAGDELVTIGKPIANTQFYILDDELNLVPPGSVGDLYIGGDGVAIGYLNRPELTSERFIANPFISEDKNKIYKTGDLAKLLSDGRYQCLGRSDNQVKIRGFRIELGEIESVLEAHMEVKEAAVIAFSPSNDFNELAAYVSVVPDKALETQALRDYLREKLPDYMVPRFLRTLPELPKTPNGKVDRHSLPAPDTQQADPSATFEAPRTPSETTLAAIWKQVLQVDQVGIHDNFFDLGGHSLQATRVIARIREEFDLEFPLRIFFETPTIAEQSIYLTTMEADGEDEDILEMIEELEDLTDEELELLLKEESDGA